MRPKTAKRPDRMKAFTLVELLIATAIFCVLAGVLHSLLFGALHLRNSTYEKVEKALPREQLALILRRDLRGMAVPSGMLAGALSGTPAEENDVPLDTLEFYSTSGVVADGEPWGEVQKIGYYLEEPEDGTDPELGMDFFRETKRDLLATTEEEDDEDAAKWRMMRGVESLELLYWDGESWLDTWDSTAEENANPLAVKLRIAFVNADAAKRIEAPLEVVCEIAQQPRATPSTGAAAGSAAPQATPAPAPQGAQ